MTESERVSMEHIAHRRRDGWSWKAISREARACLRTMGLPCGHGREIAAQWQIERAYADCWAAMQRRRVAG